MQQNKQTLSVLYNCQSRHVSSCNVADFLKQSCRLEHLDGDALRTAKQKLTACLPHATTRGGRSSAHVVAYNKRVQLDIDHAHNKCIHGDCLDEVGAWFALQPWCEMVGVSASGRGLCVWVRTVDSFRRDLAERVIDYVEALATRSGHELNCDRVNSMSPVALRFTLNRVIHYNVEAVELCKKVLAE